MGEFKGPDNIYWLFSSSAQAIAAFIGFLAAGFFFSYDRMDKQVEKDETLEDIYSDIKKQYYSRIKTLFILTGGSIILSLVIVWINGYNLGAWGIIFKIVVGLLNTMTIIWAILFVIFIIDPSKVTKTAAKLIKENQGLFTTSGNEVLTRGQFIDKFIELEKILRGLAEKYQISIDERSRYKNFLPLGELIKMLNQREIINRHQQIQLNEVNKVRNLAAHGEISQIEPKLGHLVDKLIIELSSKSND